MSDKILIISSFFKYKIQAYLNGQDLPDGPNKDYYSTQHLKANVNSSQFIEALDNSIDNIINRFDNEYDMEYYSIDEIGLGGLGHYTTFFSR